MLKNTKVKTKLILGFSIPIILTIINVLVSVLITNYAVKTISTMNENGAVQINDGLQQLVDTISALNEEGASQIIEELRSIEGLDDAEFNKLSNFVNTGKDNRISTLEEYGNELSEFVESGKNDRIATLQSTMNMSSLISIALLVVSIIITLTISTALIKTIARSVKQLSDAAKEIAMGRVNSLELTKYADDEFGELV